MLLASFAIWSTGEWPREFTTLGLKFGQSETEALKALLTGVSIYLHLYFCAAVGADWVAFGRERKRRLTKEARFEGIPHKANSFNSWLRMIWRPVALYFQIFIEIWFPMVIGLLSPLMLWKTPYSN